MSFAGFFILLAFAIIIRLIGNRLIPLVMPAPKLKTVAVGWAGGLAGSLIDRFAWQAGPELAEIYIVGAAAGCAVSIMIFGIVPFIRIMIGKTD